MGAEYQRCADTGAYAFAVADKNQIVICPKGFSFEKGPLRPAGGARVAAGDLTDDWFSLSGTLVHELTHTSLFQPGRK